MDRLDRPKELGKSDRPDWLNKLDKSYIPDRSAWTINGQMSQIVLKKYIWVWTNY